VAEPGAQKGAGNPGQSNYGSAKAAIAAFTVILADTAGGPVPWPEFSLANLLGVTRPKRRLAGDEDLSPVAPRASR